MTSILVSDLVHTIKPGRAIEGASAVLVPYLPGGAIDEPGFQTLLRRTWAAGLTPAVNMDTGYVNLLDDADRSRVLALTREVAAGRPFIAGAFIEGKSGETFALYRDQIGQIQRHGGTPIIFPCTATQHVTSAQLVALFRELGQLCPKFLGFELGQMFVPFGRIFDLETIRELMEIPTLAGIKHSSLERELEWERLALRDRVRPEFRIYTGNDLAVDLVMYGSDYLLGLSAFYPEAFALRDALWARQDPGFFQLNDLIQYLGFLVFRPPVPGYKHNAAQFLHLRGLIKTSLTHVRAVERPESDVALLADILQRFEHLIPIYQRRIA